MEKLEKKLAALGVENYLLEKGVDEESISGSKSSVATIPGEMEFYYDEKEKLEEILIPLSMVKGVSRIEGFSWFDMLNYGVMGLPSNISTYDFNLSTVRFLNIMKWLEENDLNAVKNMFINTGNIRFLCFKNGEKEEYYQVTDGNHRVITAKVLGISHIKAKYVHVYEYNAEKHHAYKFFKEKEKEAQGIIGELGLTYGNPVVLDTEGWFGVVFNFTYDEYSLIWDFSRIDTMIAEMNELLERLNKIKENAAMYFSIYKLLPGRIRNFIKKLIPSVAEESGISHIIALNKAAAAASEKMEK